MKILLIGASGQLGSDLVRNNQEHEIFAPGREQLDLARPEGISAIVQYYRPHIIINCAAFHNVPLCEECPDQAFLVNCMAVRNLAAVASEIRAWFVTFSSDYVFGGGNQRTPYREDSLPAPVQIYGISRLAGEYAALATAPERAIVIRTCGLYGFSGARSKGGNFVDGRVTDALSGRRIEIASEQIVSPTSTDDLSRAVLSMIGHPGLAPGTYHLVNDGQCSWYELTRAIVEITGLETKVIPLDRGGRSGKMRRPLYSVLENTRAREMGISMRPWRDALADYLRIKYPELFEKRSPLGKI